jgi:hypothetical protein
MDSTEDSLAIIGQFSKQSAYCPSGLAVKSYCQSTSLPLSSETFSKHTRSRLIEEEKQIWLGRQLDANSQALSLLNI